MSYVNCETSHATNFLVTCTSPFHDYNDNMAEKLGTSSNGSNGSTPVRPEIKKSDTDKDFDDYFVREPKRHYSYIQLYSEYVTNTSRLDLATWTTTPNGPFFCVSTAQSHPK
jgi:hypothetical protein